MTDGEKWGCVANYAGDSAFRKGARVFVLSVSGANTGARVHGHSRGGRTIRKWVPFRKLSNFRVAMFPPGHPEIGCGCDSKEAGAEWADNCQKRSLYEAELRASRAPA